MRLLKIIFLIFILFIFVCLLAIGALFYFFDPDQIKPALIEEIEKTTGYKMVIEDKLTWSLYPALGVKAAQVRLYAPHQSVPVFSAKDIQIAVDSIRLLKEEKYFSGTIYISELDLSHIHAEKIRAVMHTHHEAVAFTDIAGDLYQGKLTGSIRGDNLSSLAHWQWNLQLHDADIKFLLQDLRGRDSKINLSGKGQLFFQGEVPVIHADREHLLKALNGTAAFSLNNGIVDGMDINYFLQMANAIFNKEAQAPLTNTNQTAFESLTGSWVIKNGTAETSDLFLKAPAFTVKGQGHILLNSSEINLHLQAKPQLEHAVIHWEIPLVLTGNIDKPDVQLDKHEINKDVKKEQINKLKEKAIKKIQQYVPGETGEFLQNLLR